MVNIRLSARGIRQKLKMRRGLRKRRAKPRTIRKVASRVRTASTTARSMRARHWLQARKSKVRPDRGIRSTTVMFAAIAPKYRKRGNNHSGEDCAVNIISQDIRKRLDPVTLEVIRNAIPAISNEMSYDLQRTSYNI